MLRQIFKAIQTLNGYTFYNGLISMGMLRAKNGICVLVLPWESKLFSERELLEYVEIRAHYQRVCTSENSTGNPKDCNGMASTMLAAIPRLGVKYLYGALVRSGSGINASNHVATGLICRGQRVRIPAIVLDPIGLFGSFLSPTTGSAAQETELNGLGRYTWNKWIERCDANYGVYDGHLGPRVDLTDSKPFVGPLRS